MLERLPPVKKVVDRFLSIEGPDPKELREQYRQKTEQLAMQAAELSLRLDELAYLNAPTEELGVVANQQYQATDQWIAAMKQPLKQPLTASFLNGLVTIPLGSRRIRKLSPR